MVYKLYIHSLNLNERQLHNLLTFVSNNIVYVETQILRHFKTRYEQSPNLLQRHKREGC